ncbi:TM2 domain-containing protein [Hymenobacter armeniacus]|uniref:TM2 domain-containing protein n=1 Tax=Hymenobacter armeniacus TaxID=2771358 RepID=UPI001CC245CF|nr:TM2 domain-containing protein [Hymenobacter armeniacus]
MLVGQPVAAATIAPRRARVSSWHSAERGAPARVANDTVPQRSKGVAVVLALLLGVFGAHQFYLGYVGRGFLYLGLTAAAAMFLTLGLLAIAFGGPYGGFITVAVLVAFAVQAWLISDIVRILTGSLAPKDGEYFDRFF